MKPFAHFILLFCLGTLALSAQPSPQPASIRSIEPPRAVSPPEPLAPQPFHPGKADPAEMEARKEKLRQSFRTWQKLKQECGGDYSYKKHWSSWVGFGHETTVIVENNQVVARSFRSFSGRPVPVAPGQTPQPEGKTWTERGPDLGKHKEGHPPKTLDELYAEAKAMVHGPVPPFNRMSLRMDKNGLLLACYLQDTRIADDAPTKGVNLTSITLGKKETLLSSSQNPHGPFSSPEQESLSRNIGAIRPKDKPEISVRCRAATGWEAERWPDGFRKTWTGTRRQTSGTIEPTFFFILKRRFSVALDRVFKRDCNNPFIPRSHLNS